MRRVVSVVLLLVLVTPAWGQSDDARARARAHYERGEAAQRAGDYVAAIAAYQAAFDLAPLPGLLFNLGQAHRLKGDRREALSHYRRYLATAPTGRAAVEAEGHVRALEDALASTPPAPAPAPAPAPENPAPPPAHRGNPLRVVGYVTAGAGLAALGAGVYFGLHARNLARDNEVMFDPDDERAGEAAERNMLIASAIGGAALVAGVTMILLGRPLPVEVAPVAVRGGGGLVFAGSF